MFIGHFGVGFAGKRAASAVSLGTLFLAVQFADGLWPLLLLLGVEHVRIAPGTMKLSPFDFYDYPWSHSLVAIVVCGVLLGGAYYVLRRSRRGAAVVAAGVVSHWFLDFLVHRPDMPVFPRGPYLGLGLWNSLPATVLLEAGFYAGGIALYVTETRAKDRTGTWSLWFLILLLFAIWISSFLAPPPPNTGAIAVSGIAMWSTIPWGYWIDRHRVLR
ncbi:MAG TPA: hypothetical protein VK416_06380 [Thermoanaerobaculia bacterium]|nr:hypothetical protein [Thermoanaerobaculia bacterium]